MSDHLPECPKINEKPDWYCCEDCDPGPWDDCICDWLRACEQRVRLHAALSWEEGFQEGRSSAFDAAREAVERVSTLFEPLGRALDAIDALRDKQ